MVVVAVAVQVVVVVVVEVVVVVVVVVAIVVVVVVVVMSCASFPNTMPTSVKIGRLSASKCGAEMCVCVFGGRCSMAGRHQEHDCV